MTAAVRGVVAAAYLIAFAMPAMAHSPSRQLIGIHSPDRGLRPNESWGTYCVTELAPLFREAVAINIEKGLSPARWPLNLAQAATSPTPPAAAPVSPSDINITRTTPPGGAPDAMFPQIVPPAGKITVLLAKKFVTMDPGWPEATAVAVAEGKIVSVGVTFDDLKPWLDKYPYEIDDRFKDKVIYPGFVEAHTHPVMGSLAISRPSLSHFPLRNPYGPDIPGTKNRADAIAKLKQFVAAAKPGETILTWGYDILAMGEDFDRKQLDEISATQALIVWDASEHYVYANGAAIRKYGVTEQQIASTVGAGRYPDGSSDGRFLGTDAARLILPQVIAEQMQPEAAKTNLRYLGALMQQAGVTTLGDLFFGGVNLELETLLSKTFYDNPSSIARIVHVPDGFTFKSLFGDQAVDKVKELEASSSDRTIYRGVKFYADDAFLSLGMEMQWPGYVDADRYKGLFMYSSEKEFTEAMRPWWNAGMHIHVHSNGSGGNEITLDALANLQAEKPRFDHRFTFEHFGISSVAQGRRVKALGAQVSTNPYYVYERADLTAPQIGTDRASLASRMKSLVDQDVVLSLHSDTPVGVPSPLLEVWVAVNRIGYGTSKVHAPHERVDVARAMKMVTIDAAATLGVEDRVGTIETGKFADFTVLDADPQEVEPMKIRDINVVATILGGRITMTADTRTP
jgi:predicted amidohydrolase YtcJ